MNCFMPMQYSVGLRLYCNRCLGSKLTRDVLLTGLEK